MLVFSDDKKNLLSNFFSLTALQVANMALPLITLPYLVRVLGVENFGLVNFALSIIMYFNILVSFGFELSATRKISMHRDNKKMVAEIFSTVMTIKIGIALISFSILSMLIVNIGTFQEQAMLYYMTFGLVLGNVMFPTWFFQGMEKMKYITYINVISRIIFTILIFIIVRENTDFIYVPILNSLGAILGGFYSLWLIFTLFHIRLSIPKKDMIILELKDSYHFFLSRAANDGSRHFAITFIGIYFGNHILGYYSMVEKLFYAFISLGGLVSQTIYPYMSRTRDLVFFKKILTSVLIMTILILIPTIYFSENIINLVFNLNDKILSKIFLIIFSGSIFGIAGALIGYPLLAAFGHTKFANNSLIYASVFYIIYIIIVGMLFKNIYLVSFSLPFYMITGLMFRLHYIKKSKVWFYNK